GALLTYSFYVWAARRASAIFLVVDSAAGMSAVVAHHFSGIGDSAEFSRTVVNVRLQPPRASLIRGWPAQNGSGTLVKFAAIRRASSRFRRFGRRAMRRSNMSGIGGEADVRGMRLKRR